MKKRILAVSLILACAVLMAVLGCLILGLAAKKNAGTRYFHKTNDGLAVYENAMATVWAEKGAALSVTKTTRFVIGGEVFKETAQQNIQYLNGSAKISELLTIGDHRIEISEILVDGTDYITLNGSRFSGQISANDFQKRLPPAVLLDVALYEKVTAFRGDDLHLIYFEQPTAPESWFAETIDEFLGARGTACIRTGGKVAEAVYAISYKANGITYHTTISCKATGETIDIQAPEDPESYRAITDPDAPRLMERACGFLMQADKVTSVYRDRVYYQAFGDERTQTITIHAGTGESWGAKVDTEAVITNTGRPGEATKHDHMELFYNNTYTLYAAGSDPTTDDSVDLPAMQKYCNNLLISTIMLPQHIVDTVITETEATRRITFIVTSDFTNQIGAKACDTLYAKPDLMDELAESHTVNKMECYLELDLHTDIPVASGIVFSGTYRIQGLPYLLEFQAEQTYSIPSDTALAEIQNAVS